MLLFFSQVLLAQTKDARVSLDLNNEPVENLFAEIEVITSLKFSFNSELINQDSLITYQCTDKKTSKVVKEVFDDRILTKTIGRHLVLVENEKNINNEDITSPLVQPSFYGSIKDARTKHGIQDVNVYDVYNRKSVLTDSNGKFTFENKSFNTNRTYNIAKRGYKNEIISIDWAQEKSLDILLKPIAKEEKIEALGYKPASIPIQEKSDFLLGLVPMNSLVTVENLQDVDNRRVQVSFLPYMGTTCMTKGMVTNHFSFNIIGGYNGGVDGVEVGGVFNIIDKNVKGVQIAGVSNLVAGETQGFQIAGVFNRTRGEVGGLQSAGVFNEGRDKIDGTQIAGVFNISKDRVDGMQIAGVFNTIGDSLNGAQIAGVYNKVEKQINGFQIAGVYNKSISKIEGGQIGGVYNVAADSLIGVQIAGVKNTINGNLYGTQISSILNTVKGENKGTQIGIVNRAGSNNGLQIGIVNYAENSSKPGFGLFNFVKNGYTSMSISSNELTHISLKIKTGMKKFYSSYSFGMRPSDAGFYSVGLGWGSQVNLSDRSFLDINLSTSLLHINSNKDHKFAHNNIKLDFALGYQLSEHWEIFLSPSYNMLFAKVENEDLSGFKDDILPYQPIHSSRSGKNLIHQWIGGSIGVQYLF